MQDSVKKYLWNVAGDWAYTQWIGNMQNADHYNNLHMLMPVFLLLNFFSSFTIHFERHKDKNWENTSCLPTFIYETMSYLFFLLECGTRCETNIGTNWIFVRVLNLSSLLLPSSPPLSHLSEAEKRTKGLYIFTFAEDFCTCVQGKPVAWARNSMIPNRIP